MDDECDPLNCGQFMDHCVATLEYELDYYRIGKMMDRKRRTCNLKSDLSSKLSNHSSIDCTTVRCVNIWRWFSGSGAQSSVFCCSMNFLQFLGTLCNNNWEDPQEERDVTRYYFPIYHFHWLFFCTSSSMTIEGVNHN